MAQAVYEKQVSTNSLRGPQISRHALGQEVRISRHQLRRDSEELSIKS